LRLSGSQNNRQIRYFPTLGKKKQARGCQVGSIGQGHHADSCGWFDTCHPAALSHERLVTMSELASTESLHKLDQRHEELLVKLAALCSELETALNNLVPKSEETQLKEAA
jgi:hypothetical protein